MYKFIFYIRYIVRKLFYISQTDVHYHYFRNTNFDLFSKINAILSIFYSDCIRILFTICSKVSYFHLLLKCFVSANTCKHKEIQTIFLNLAKKLFLFASRTFNSYGSFYHFLVIFFLRSLSYFQALSICSAGK